MKVGRVAPSIQVLSQQSWYALPPVSPVCVNIVNHRRAGTGIAVALSLLLATTSHGQEEGAGAEVPAADADWEEVKRESREAFNVWSEVARSMWSAARTRVEDSWTATEETTGDTVETLRDGSANALDSTRQGAREAWEEATEESKQIWRQTKPKVAGVVADAAREGGKALDAARQAGRTFWQILARNSPQPSAADADPLTVTGRTPSSHLDIGSAMPSVPLGPCARSPRRLDALATKAGEKCGLLESEDAGDE